jgi:hypothetical protein
MLVDRHIAHAILTGHIQQHRLPVGPDGPTRMTPSRGRRLNIATARGLACTVEVTSCRRQEHLQSLTDTSLKALGHDTLEAWARRWLLERDSQWLMRRVPEDVGTLVTSDEELDAALDTLTDEQVLERFHQRWAVRTVWARMDTPRARAAHRREEVSRPRPRTRQPAARRMTEPQHARQRSNR